MKYFIKSLLTTVIGTFAAAFGLVFGCTLGFRVATSFSDVIDKAKAKADEIKEEASESKTIKFTSQANDEE